ncbi:hypothetical protein L6452_12233 [Arctium lappa]|uniref:Uncharacterized protein n=1 Tax=Arctium lappa TaxID=4217 RepID=A0ACB9DQW5_ARCLA|nr:hypothetical protein L6452_12233 [Arctium lappa]
MGDVVYFLLLETRLNDVIFFFFLVTVSASIPSSLHLLHHWEEEYHTGPWPVQKTLTFPPGPTMLHSGSLDFSKLAFFLSAAVLSLEDWAVLALSSWDADHCLTSRLFSFSLDGHKSDCIAWLTQGLIRQKAIVTVRTEGQKPEGDRRSSIARTTDRRQCVINNRILIMLAHGCNRRLNRRIEEDGLSECWADLESITLMSVVQFDIHQCFRDAIEGQSMSLVAGIDGCIYWIDATN